MVFLIWATVSAVLLARLPISAATTANPLPASPALAASIEAFNERRFICSAISEITSASCPMFSTTFEFAILSSRLCSNLFDKVLADSKDFWLFWLTISALFLISSAIFRLCPASCASKLTFDNTSSEEAFTSWVAALVESIEELISFMNSLICSNFSSRVFEDDFSTSLFFPISTEWSLIFWITPLLLSYILLSELLILPSSSSDVTLICSTLKSPSANEPAKSFTLLILFEILFTIIATLKIVATSAISATTIMTVIILLIGVTNSLSGNWSKSFQPVKSIVA